MKRWPLNKAYFWETVPFFRLLLPLIAGIVMYPYLVRAFDVSIFFIVTGLLLTCSCYIVAATAKQHSGVVKYWVFTCMHLSLIFAAWALCYTHDIRNNNAWFGHTIQKADGYVATITGAPAEKEKTWKLQTSITHAISDGKTSAVCGKAFVYVYKYNSPALKEGDVIIIPNRWQVIKNSGNPFEFDYAAYTARDNIYYQQFIPGDEISIHTYAEETDLNRVRRVHHWSVKQLEWHITDRATLGLLKAIITGDKEQQDTHLTDAYAGTGIVHIMAISGAHISVFFLLLAALLIWVKHKRYRWVKYLAALPLIWIYVAVAGAPTSAVRAATMFSLLGIGFSLQKNPNGVNQLLATAFILLCANPMWLYDVGFQLSFTAVLSIFLFYKRVYRWYSPIHKITRAVWSAIAVSIAAEILVSPLVIYYFNLFPLQFIVANVLAYMFMSVALVGGMVLIAVSGSYTIAHAIAAGLTSVTTRFNKLIFGLQELNFGSFHKLTLTNLPLILVYISIAAIAVFLIKKHKQALFIGLTCCCAFLLSSCVKEWRSLQQNLFIVYNTSRGSHIELVQGSTSTTLYSPENVDPETEKYVLTPAHTHLHIKDTLKRDENLNRLKLGNRVIFIVNQLIKDTTIPADIVVLNKAKGIEIATIKKVFSPEKIVISSAIPAGKAEAWMTEAGAMGIEVHNVRNDGAFVAYD